MKSIRRSFTMAGIIGLLAFFGGISHAQEAPMTPYGISYGSPETFAEFHGFVNLEYSDFQDEGERNGVSTFDQHNFYFNAIAKVRQNVTVFGEVEYEHGGGEIKLDRAYMDWQLHGEHLDLRLGKFYSPFGLEIKEYQAPIRKLVSRPQMTDALLFHEWTEVGINVYGQVMPGLVGLTYDIALVNGPGGSELVDTDEDGIPDTPLFIADGEEARQNRDNNSSRTVVGRISVPIKHDLHRVEVGVSWGGGRYSDADAPEDLDFSLTGVDAHFRMAGMDLRGEYVQRKADIPGGDEIKSNSYYLQASYRASFKQDGLNYLEPVIRYDYLEPDDDTDDDETTRIALGINYSPIHTWWSVQNTRSMMKREKA